MIIYSLLYLWWNIKLFAFLNYYATQTIGFNIDNFNMINMQHGKGRGMTIQRNELYVYHEL